MSPLSIDVRDNPGESRFELPTTAGPAFAAYQVSGKTITVYHTEVPASLRGSGIGEQLVLGMFADIKRMGLKLVPRCWFVREVLSRHPEYQDLMTA